MARLGRARPHRPFFSTHVESPDATVSPATVAGVATVGVPTLAAGSVVSPATVAGVATVGVPTFAAGSTVAPAVVASVATVGTPTFSAGSTVAAAVVSAVAAVGTPIPSAGSTLAAAVVQATATVGAPTLAAGSTVSPATVAGVATVGAPTLAAGSVVTPAVVSAVATVSLPTLPKFAATVSAVATVGTPTLAAGSTVSPVRVPAVTTVGAPTLAAGSVVTPVRVAAVATVGTPTLVAGSVVTPTTVQARAYVGGWSVTDNFNRADGSAGNGWDFGAITSGIVNDAGRSVPAFQKYHGYLVFDDSQGFVDAFLYGGSVNLSMGWTSGGANVFIGGHTASYSIVDGDVLKWEADFTVGAVKLWVNDVLYINDTYSTYTVTDALTYEVRECDATFIAQGLWSDEMQVHAGSGVAPATVQAVATVGGWTFSDDFERADGAPGNGWSGGSIVSGAIVGYSERRVPSSLTWSGSWVAVVNPSSGTTSSGGNGAYGGGADLWDVYWNAGFLSASIHFGSAGYSETPYDLQIGDLVEWEVSLTQIRVWVNGVLQLTLSESVWSLNQPDFPLQTAGAWTFFDVGGGAGFTERIGSYTVRHGLRDGSDALSVHAGSVVTPSTVQATASVGTPTFVAGSVITPAVVPAVATVGAPTVAAGAVVSPVRVAAVATVGSPTLAAGSTVSPVRVLAVTTVGSPKVHFEAYQNFEGTDEVDIGSTDLWFSGAVGGTGTVKFDTAFAVQGSSSMRVTTTDGTATNRLITYGATTKLYFSTYWMPDDPTLVNTTTLLNSGDGSTVGGSVRLNQTGFLRLNDETAAASVNSALAIVANQWYRLDWEFDVVAQSQTLKIFTGANIEGSTPDSTITTSYNNNAQGLTQVTRVRMGNVNNAGQAISFWYDAAAYSTLAMPGPRGAVSAAVTPANVQATATIGSPTLAAGSVVSPVRVAAVATVGAPTLAAGSVVAPSTVQAVATVGSATLAVGSTVTPDTVQARSQVGAYEFYDDFERADGPIGNGWTTETDAAISDGQYFTYDGSRAERNFPSSQGFRMRAMVGRADDSIGDAIDQVVAFYGADDDPTYYISWFWYQNGDPVGEAGNGVLYLDTTVNGEFLEVSYPFDVVEGDVIEAVSDGLTYVRVYANGVLGIDLDIADVGGGTPGLISEVQVRQIHGGLEDLYFQNAVVGTQIHAGSVVTPSVVQAVATVGTPTLAAGAVVTPAVVSAVATVGVPTLPKFAATVQAVATVGSPTLAAGSTVAPSTVQATTTVGAPTLAAGAVVTPIRVAAVATVGSPTVATGSVVSPVRVAAIATVGAPTIAAGAVVTPVRVLAVATVGAPTLAAGSVVTPTTVRAITAVGGRWSFSDDFERVDAGNGTLGGGWDHQSGLSASITAGVAYTQSEFAYLPSARRFSGSVVYEGGDPLGGNVWEFDISAFDFAGGYIDAYFAYNSDTDSLGVFAYSDPGGIQSAKTATVVLVSGDVIDYEVDFDDHYKLWVNGVLTVTLNNSSLDFGVPTFPLTAVQNNYAFGLFGGYFGSASVQSGLRDGSDGTIVHAGSVVTPIRVAAVATVGSATVAAGSVVTPATVAATTYIPAPSTVDFEDPGVDFEDPDTPFGDGLVIHAGSTVSAATVQATTTIGSPTLAAGSVSTPVVVQSIATVGAPSFQAGSTVTPSVVQAIATVGSPSIQAGGGANIGAAVVSAVATVGSPTVAAGSVVTPSAVAATASVGSPTIAAGAVVTPAVVQAVVTVGSPTLSASSTVLATTVLGSASVGTPTLVAGATVSASSVQAVASVGTPVLAAGSTASPATVPAVATVGSPTVIAGSATTATPAVVQAVATVGTPVPSAGSTVTPSTVPAFASVTSVTPSDSQAVTPATVPVFATVGVATLAAGAVLTATRVLALATVGAPTISASALVSPAVVPVVATVGTAVPAAGSVVTAATVNTYVSIGSPGVSASVLVAPTTVQTVATIGAPTVIVPRKRFAGFGLPI